MPVLTGSMAPLIRPGDEVLVANVPPAMIGRGDIIVFRRNNDLIVHRVAKKWQEGQEIRFREQGDASHVFGTVLAAQVVGRVAMVRSRCRILDLSSPLSRIISRALTLWLYQTSDAVDRLKGSNSGTIKRAGRIISQSSFRVSNLLLKTCFAICYMSVLLARENGKTIRAAVAGEKQIDHSD